MLTEITHRVGQSQDIAGLEDIAGLADVRALLDCEDIDRRVGVFMKDMNDDIVAQGLEGYLKIVHSRPKHLSLFTPQLTYDTVKVFQRRDIPEDFEGLARYVFDAHKRVLGIVHRLVSDARERQMEKYSPLLALTVKERPFVQEYLVGETVLYFICQGYKSLYRAEVNIELGTYGTLSKVSLDEGKSLGMMMWDDVFSEKNVYQVYNPSRKIPLKALMAYVTRTLKKEFDDNLSPKDIPEHVCTLMSLGPRINEYYTNYWFDVVGDEQNIVDDILKKYSSRTPFDALKGKNKPN